METTVFLENVLKTFNHVSHGVRPERGIYYQLRVYEPSRRVSETSFLPDKSVRPNGP